ncbi:hypothetical protein [Flavobacterium hercynium]|uniref:Uncharacterized protein n=1 Tax=Flavobacterium hercynium TaxID=387094 RepID=A0A226HEK6_9FLAO|nr:hypothetical protein [Flavobacterium hercynium]OXA92524.1 hypothetical protein B0A66_09595 [Flavobacterium hercynium]SMP21496.1 hypothetical protein SAMN06265346_10737 [Flavobacterium hercynium]
MSNQTLETEIIFGGWSTFEKPTAEEIAIFNKALEGYSGVHYSPLFVSAQVADGMIYRFRCLASIPPSKRFFESLLMVFKPYDSDAYIVRISRI